jgi:thiamine biosynthesis lipoprotein
MGTVFRFEAPVGQDPGTSAEALESALDEVDRLEGVLSNWREGSELSRLNRGAGSSAVPVSRDLFDAVREALHWAEETGGAFDPTVEPLTRKFRAGGDGRPRIGRTAALPGGWREVQIDPEARTIRFGPGVEGLDLGGIGKGFALDRAAVILRSRGVSSFLLDAGGQVLAAGRPPGEEGWLIGVVEPSRRERPSLSLLLRDASAATSGNSQRAGEILDPSTGLPVAGAGSATAVAPDATSADALSTALFVLGPERGTAWARNRKDAIALFLLPGKDSGASPSLRSTLAESPGKGETIVISSTVQASGRIVNASIR